MTKPGFVGTIMTGGLLGALLISVLTHLIYKLAYARAIYDGQYGMIFMGTAPVGWLLGSAVGAAVAWCSRARPRRAGWVAGLLIAGGVMIGPFIGLGAVMVIGLAWSLLHPHG